MSILEGIILGAIFLIGLIALIIMIVKMRNKEKQTKDEDEE